MNKTEKISCVLKKGKNNTISSENHIENKVKALI